MMSPGGVALVLFFVTIAVFGFCFIVGSSKISYGPRRMMYDRGGLPGRIFVMLIECPSCLGFWIGLLAGGLHPPQGFGRFSFALLMGCYMSGANFILGKITGLIHDTRA